MLSTTFLEHKYQAFVGKLFLPKFHFLSYKLKVVLHNLVENLDLLSTTEIVQTHYTKCVQIVKNGENNVCLRGC